MIVSYPDIKDVFYAGKLALPTTLVNGFLLDNRGIGPDAAFLSYTYDEYAALEKTPDPKDLLAHIIDKDPIEIMYSCNCNRDSSLISDMLTSGKMDKFYKIK